jgi:hypothetical protein
MHVSSPCRLLAVICLCVASSLPATASPINIDTGKSVSVNPGSSGTLTLSLTNEASGTAVSTFNSWAFILQIIPGPGATGTASFTGLVSPTVNPALAAPGEPLFDNAYTTNVPVNGTTSAYLVGIGNDTSATTTFALGQTYNAADFTVALSPDATGSWAIYALNDENNTTAWLTAGGVATAFGNAPIAAEGAYTSVQIGTISAVPEPSSLLLAGSGIVAAGWYARRMRRMPAMIEA